MRNAGPQPEIMKLAARAFIAAQCFCSAAHAANLTTASVLGNGTNWTYPIWKTNGTGLAVSPIAGNTYGCVFNGVAFGNNKNNTRIRNPASAGMQTFPGDSLTLTTNTELRAKQEGAVLNFPGVGGNPGLILNGGVLNAGDDAVFVITGKVQVATQSYICPADAGGGAVTPLRGFDISGQLSGSGTMVIFQAGTTVAQQISGNSNTFSGRWIVKAGWLLGSGLNSLGTNDITVDPNFVLLLDSSIINVAGPALFEVNYDLNSAGQLILTNGSVMNLHQNCAFSAVKVEGASLSPGTHYYAELAANFPSNFAPGGSGGITVQSYGSPPPVAPTVATQPASVTLYAGSSAQLVATASGSLPLFYQWKKGTNSVYVNATDIGDVSGSTTDTLTFSALTFADAADYRLVVTNSLGAATSQVATVSVLPFNATNPVMTALVPSAGATVSNLTEIQVTFSKSVVGVDAEDFLINGLPAGSVTGSGSNYIFAFTQPRPVGGTILVYWDVDSAITDLSGNSFDPSISWSYTLMDNIPPAMVATGPSAGATVGWLTQAQVIFSEPVTGVDAADLLINGVAATSVGGSGFGPYVFQFSQPAQGTVQFSWAAGHNIRDLSPAANHFDGTGWTVELNSAATAAALTNIVINEFLAANANPGGLTDEDGQLDDWIEIYNRGGTIVNLAGWSLTDNAGQPGQWSFPTMDIAPGQFVVVFASGKDRRIPGANLHTSFALNAAGEYLGLYNPDFPPRVVHEFSPAYPKQRNDYSYGLDGGGDLRYFTVQTPGAPNSSSTLTGVVAAMHFSVDHGFFNQPFKLVLTTTTPGATILYTTNGSEPSISGAINGIVYTAPIGISKTTALRAAAFAPDRLPSLVGSRSYFFVEDIIRQPNNPTGYATGNAWTPTPGTIVNGSRAYYQMDPFVVNQPQYTNSVRAGLLSIPTLSLILPIPDLFDPVNGIYTHPQSRGVGWERACSMELMFADGSDGLQLDCGLQIQGGTQRDPAKNAKHSFRVNFKGDYGSSKLDFGVFPDSPVESLNTLVLDGGINYWWHYVGASSPADQRFRAQCVRDQFTSDLLLALGHPSFHGRFHHLYLNGLYWGLHYVHERTDDEFAAGYFGGSSANYDVIRNTTVGTEIVAGDLNAWNSALALANSGLSNNAQYVQLQDYVDIENLIDYMIVNHWVGNDDWPQHNWYVIRKRATGRGFKFMIWDAEHVLKDVNINRTTVTASGSPAQIYNALRNNAEFRLLFADHLQKHFFNGGTFYTDPANSRPDPVHPERNMPASLYLKRITEIDTAIVDESARWGGYTLTTNYTRNDHWLRELNNLLGYTNNPGNTANYFPQRSANVLNQYRTIGLFPSVNAPVFGTQGGNVPVGFSLTITNPNAGGKIYYTTNGNDPRVYASGAVAFAALAYTNGFPVTLPGSAVIKARVLSGGTWSALNQAAFSVASLGVPIRITELMYNPIGGDAYEFIELQNVGAVPVDLSSYSFEGITFVFSEGTALAAGEVLLLASSANPAAFASRYPGVVVAGYYGGQLSNGGERIALLDGNGSTIVSVDYQDSGGWPTAADGGGASLEIINPNGDPDDPANWRASIATNGTPGAAPIPPALNAVRLNEVMAENAGAVTNGGTFPDWIELYNAGTITANIANWSFSNSGNPRKFVFPNGTSLAAGGYLVVWCDSQTNAPGLHAGFTLGRKGESLFLYDTATNRVDALSFGLQLTNYTVGRTGSDSAWQLTLPTPGANNTAATVGSATNLLINEWLANSAPGGSDWLELYDMSSNQPVALSGLYLATSNALFHVSSLSFLGPRDFVQLFADESPGFDHLDFKLAGAGDAITLYDYSGQKIDRVSFTNQIEGVSQGRLPNGSPTIISFPGTASPGAANYVIAYAGPRLNEVMARNISAVYDSRGNNPDWIEIFNPNATNYSLAGMGLSTDPTQPGQWIVPAGVSISANGYLVIWCDSSRPASTNGTPELNFGRSLSGDGDGVYLFNANGQVVDSVAFGFQVADLSIGKNAGAWGLLSSPTPGAPNAATAALGNVANLRINEWMANPAAGNDWFELYNLDTAPVPLGGLYLTDNPSITGMTNSQVSPLSFIAAHGWVKFEADNNPGQGPNHVKFSLDKGGETIRLYSANLALIDAVDFGLQTTGVSQGRLPDGGSNNVSFFNTPTPDASNYLPLPNVVINEVLTHTDPPLEDTIELYNPGGNSVAIGGWFVSNSQTDFKKYRVANGTALPAGGFKVFYEYQFNSTNAVPFTLNAAHGDSVFLAEADLLGNLTGYRAQVSFGAAQNGVSFGRFVTSTGVDFVSLGSRTFGVDNPSTVAQFRTGTGLTNSAPKTGPVVINEIMYHPVTLSGTNLSENTDEEFIELFNITSGTVPLYDPLPATNHWKLGGSIDYEFPAGVTLPAGGFAIVVGFDPVANPAALANFRLKYGVATNAPIYGPYRGKLNNTGESVQLFKPDTPQTAPHPDAGFVPYVQVDFVNYGDVAPWPSAADGTGMSLQRRALGSYGNEPLNWIACSPTPGSRNCVNDADGDGLPDDWELANGLNPYSADGDDGANGNPDGDAFSNLQEYLAGTDPHNAQSYLRLESITRAAGAVSLSFVAAAGRSYSIQYRPGLATGDWQKLTDVEASSVTALMQVSDPAASSAARFYRLVTPKQP